MAAVRCCEAALSTALGCIPPLSAPRGTQASATAPSTPEENNQWERPWNFRVYYKNSKWTSYRNKQDLTHI